MSQLQRRNMQILSMTGVLHSGIWPIQINSQSSVLEIWINIILYLHLAYFADTFVPSDTQERKAWGHEGPSEFIRDFGGYGDPGRCRGA